MQKILGFIPIVILCFISLSIKAQVYSPEFSFDDNVISHTAHITYCLGYYYTCNGGDADDGKVSIFDSNGNLVSSYSIRLDMRSIAYNARDNKFYISTKDKKIYLINDFVKGEVDLKYGNLYVDGNSAITFSHDGKWLYIFDNGILTKYDFKKGTIKNKIPGLLAGDKASTGANTIAFDGKYIYTWDSAKKIIYCWSKKGKFVKSFKISEGDFGYTLSYANGYIFVANDAGEDIKGKWFAYKFWD